MQYAKQQAKLAASEIQTSIVFPKKGAAKESTPISNNALIGVLRLG